MADRGKLRSGVIILNPQRRGAHAELVDPNSPDSRELRDAVLDLDCARVRAMLAHDARDPNLAVRYSALAKPEGTTYGVGTKLPQRVVAMFTTRVEGTLASFSLRRLEKELLTSGASVGRALPSSSPSLPFSPVGVVPVRTSLSAPSEPSSEPASPVRSIPT